ncbi:vacuolar protein sorting-associated protein 4B-like [Amblyomma americanum]|uniref:ATPase AAA-type core domain-containing protein n=1 Tax=Amblyomma americanum TaxID=6943 RepID=A0AAQ4ED14_AMBAM
MNRLVRARRHAERAAFLEIVSEDHAGALAHYTQAALHLESALELILCRIRTHAAKLRTLRPHVASPERWEHISLPPSRTRTSDKRYVCEVEGLVVLGRHCGRCVDVGFPDVLRQLFQLMQIPSFCGGSRRALAHHRPDSCRTVLLSGPAATGRHSLARALSSGIRVCSVTYVYMPQLLRDSKEQLEIAIRSVFDASGAVVPTVIILDRLDEICTGAATADAELRQVFCECIRDVLDSHDMPSRYVIGVTNSPWLLSAELQTLFQRRVYVPLPDHTCRATITQHLLSGSDGYASALSLADIADATEGFTSTELAMCLRSPFWHTDSREKLEQRFVELVGVSGLGSVRCCFCLGEEQEELTQPEFTGGSEGPEGPRSSPLFPIDADLQKAIREMSAVLARNTRPRNPIGAAGMKASTKSSERNCRIC